MVRRGTVQGKRKPQNRKTAVGLLHPKTFPSLFKLGHSTADEPDNLHRRTHKPAFAECGSCGHYHPMNFSGDCRDDDNRFTSEALDKKYGPKGWTEIDTR